MVVVAMNRCLVTKNRCLVTKNRPPERPHHAHLKKRAGEARLRNFNSPMVGCARGTA